MGSRIGAGWVVVSAAVLAARLLEAVFGAHLLLSSDRARKTELRRYGGPGYRHLPESFVPLLRQAGLKDAAVRMLLVDNPARALQIRSGASSR